MLAAQRKAAIQTEVANAGALRVADLAEKLGVSEVTIRRDIDELSEQGLVAKVHGGVTTTKFSTTVEPEFSSTSQRETAAKKAIAREAATLVKPGQAVALMGGSTVFALAQELLDIEQLTIVTNSVPIFRQLSKEESKKNWTVVLAGGERTPTDSLVGPLAEQAFAMFNFDMAFMGTHGMDSVGGFSSPNMLEAEVNRRVIASTRETVVLADHTKWNVRGFSSFGPLSSASVVVVDADMEPGALVELRSHAKRVLVGAV
jgi:DeoR/GlpR family transcriptional regulator of sugar metabolism